MPDLKNRSEHEQRLAQELATLGAAWKTRITAVAGDPPNVNRIPETLWAEMETAYRDKLAAAMLVVYLLAYQGNAGDIGADYGEQAATAAGAVYAGSRAEVVAKGSVDGFADRLAARAAPAGAADKQPGELLASDIDETLEADRSDVIATTETTAATSAGERGAVDSQDKLLEAVWFTEADSLVCPICRPLHGRPQSEWPQEILLLPDLGPPAHPNCRCWLTWRAIDNPALTGAA